MRRFITIFLFVLLTLPFMVSAQDQPPLWELSADTYIDVSDLGFRFYYPVGWLWGMGSNGIVIAETQADLDAQTDDDADTLAQGLSISLLGIPLEALPESDAPRDMNDYTDFLVEVGGITETERFELPVMARRSVWVVGENSVGRSGVGTFWSQNGYLILANLGGPDAETINNYVFTWGFTVGSIEPIVAEKLGEGTLTGGVTPFSMNYPASWTASEDQPTAVVFELEGDVGQEMTAFEGIGLSVVDSPIADLEFLEDATLDGLTTTMSASFGLDETATHEEFVFLDQPAVVSSGVIDDGSGGKRGLILTSSIVDGNAVVFVLFAPTAERAAEFMPTWVAMMRTVVSTAE